MAIFLDVGSILYAQYPISFISLFEQYEQVSYYVKIQENVIIYKYGFDKFTNSDF